MKYLTFIRGNYKPQYYWNEVHMQDFVRADLKDWLTPVISGIVEVKSFSFETFFNFPS